MQIAAPSTSSLTEIVTDVWSAIVGGSDFVPGGGNERAGGTAVLAYIEITGRWDGSVRIACSPPLARHIAAGMYDKPDVEVTQEELSDAVGEFTNIVGGNVKALFPSPCELSLPGVAGMGSFGDELPPGMEALEAETKVAEAHLSWNSEHLSVVVWEGAPR